MCQGRSVTKHVRFPELRGNHPTALDRNPPPPSLAELSGLTVVRLGLGALGLVTVGLILSLMS
jgi:hypothetical protein